MPNDAEAVAPATPTTRRRHRFPRLTIVGLVVIVSMLATVPANAYPLIGG
jgi:hypothetical protein